VYRSPHDGKTIIGYREFSYALSDGKVMYQRTPDGVRVTTAFIEALDFASDSGIFAIWIDDPKELFDMALSQ
jgi:hypothetical protein